jgi:predicted RNA-binding protein with PUA-like domain
MAARKQYWLMKSEPGDFSIDDLERVKAEPWTGVRNFMARNFMLSMKRGDGVLFYHSATKVPGVYGLAEVASAPYPDPTQFDPSSHYHDPTSDPDDPRWMLVDVGYVSTLAQPITLEAIRGITAKLGDDFALTRKGNRLSVLPVSAKQWKLILGLEATAGSARDR